MKHQCIAFSGGGTLGHIYPAIPIITYIKSLDPTIKIIYIASLRDKNYKILKTTKEIDQVYYFDTIGFSKKLFQNVKVVYRLWKSRKAISQVLLNEKVSVAIGMGGYISGATLSAASKLSIKTILHEQNSVMGTANKLCIKKVSLILTAFPLEFKSERIKRKTHLVGNPRLDVARAYPNSPFKDKHRILITSGTLGSEKINQLAIAFLNHPFAKLYTTILVTGKKYYETVVSQVQPGLHYQIVSFSNKMIPLLKESGIVISRAGATTIFEILGCETVPILIPSPNVTKNHQVKNALYVRDKAIGELLLEADADMNVLIETLQKIDQNYEKYMDKVKQMNMNPSTILFANFILQDGGIESV